MCRRLPEAGSPEPEGLLWLPETTMSSHVARGLQLHWEQPRPRGYESHSTLAPRAQQQGTPAPTPLPCGAPGPRALEPCLKSASGQRHSHGRSSLTAKVTLILPGVPQPGPALPSEGAECQAALALENADGHGCEQTRTGSCGHGQGGHSARPRGSSVRGGMSGDERQSLSRKGPGHPSLAATMTITFLSQGPPGIRGPPGKEGERGEKVRQRDL